MSLIHDLPRGGNEIDAFWSDMSPDQLLGDGGCGSSRDPNSMVGLVGLVSRDLQGIC